MSFLSTLKDQIENMPKYHQIEILKILNSCENINKNENKNGTFINLTELRSEIIQQLQDYTNYVIEQQSQLNEIEQEKQNLEKTFFR
jgi:CTP-dependent riboflavin kinase